MSSEISDAVKRPTTAEQPAEEQDEPEEGDNDPAGSDTTVAARNADVLPVTGAGAVASATDLRDKGNSDLIKVGNDIKLPGGFPTIDLDGFEPTTMGIGLGNSKTRNITFGTHDTSATGLDAKLGPLSDGAGDAPNKNIKVDDKGRVTEVTYPNGTKREFGYDPQSGELNRIVQPNGQVYVLQDGKWTIEQLKPPGDQPGGPKGPDTNPQQPAGGDQGNGTGGDSSATTQGPGDSSTFGGKIVAGLGSPFGTPTELDFKNPKVGPDGTFTYEKNDGSKVKHNTDGSTETTTKDGTVIRTNDKDKVVEIKYANGDTRTFNYDSTGKLTGYSENGKNYQVRELGEVYLDGKFTGLKNPMVARDGSFTVTDANGNTVTTFADRTSSTAKGDGSMVMKNADGQVTEVQYPDGRTAKFEYDDRGRLSKITDQNGKSYEYKASFDFLGIRFGSWKAQDGSTIDNVSVNPDGTLQYTDKDGKIHKDYTSGNSTTTDKTEAELRETAWKLHESNWFFTDNSRIKDTLQNMSHADRVALDEQYKKMYGVSLSDKLRSQEWNPLKRGNIDASLDLLTESHLRTEALKTFNNPQDLAKANQLIDEFRERAKKQGVPLNQMDDIQNKAIEELRKGGFSTDQLAKLERTLTDKAPTIDSLNEKYGVKYDVVQQPDGTTVRKYYVEGENGAKLPVLDSTSDDPKEVERQLKEWQDAKMKELEQKYNVQFSRDGQKDNPLGKEVNLRSPRINELLALEEGLRKSEPSTTTPNGKPILVQFAVEPTSSASAYVYPRPDGQQRILFEPIPREFGSLKGTILHEWAHNAEHNMEARDKAALDKWYEELGYRKVTVDGRDQWQFRDKDGNYWAQHPDQPWHGTWTRVDDQGRPLKPDGTLASGWDDPNVAKQSTQQMRDNAAVKPGSDKDYFNKPWEGGAESLRWYRSSPEHRARLYTVDPANYEATKKFDQAELDSDPRYGKNPDGTSKFIRMPDGSVAENTAENRKAVADFEATLPALRAAAQAAQQQQNNSPKAQPGHDQGLPRPQGGGGTDGMNRDIIDHDVGCRCGGH